MIEKKRIFQILDEAVNSGQEVVLVMMISSSGSTPNDTGARMLVFGDGTIHGTVGGGKLEALCIEEALRALKTGAHSRKTFELTKEATGMECAGKAEMFFEVFKSRMNMLILGAGHVAQSIAHAAELAGIPYAIADDRVEFASRSRFPGALRIIVEKPDKSISHETVFSDTFIVIVTRDHALDKECLEAALQTKAAYIGMIGSKNKVKAVFGRLNEKGLHPETDQRVYAPIGLDIGGKNPGEIAISVIAEIMKISYQRTGGHSRDWKIEFLE